MASIEFQTIGTDDSDAEQRRAIREGGRTKTVSDDNFEGVSGTGLPSVDLDLSCKTGNNENPEVVVDVTQNDKWVRIPVTKATLWEDKDGAASITRTGRIHFPMELGGESILQFIDGFRSNNEFLEQKDPYDKCRIFFYDNNVDNEEESKWILKHFGYIGGVGSASNSLEGRFWVYDPADIMAGIPVDKPWTEPTYKEVLSYVQSKMEESSVFSNISLVDVTGNNVPSIKLSEQEQSEPLDLPSFEIEGNLPVIGSFQLPVNYFADSVLEFITDELFTGQKTFKPNRHNLVDLLNWFSNLADARWWFEPQLDGTALVVDSGAYKSNAENSAYERRYFVDSKAMEKWELIQADQRSQSFEQQLDDNEDEPEFDLNIDFQWGLTDNLSTKDGETNIPENYLPPSNYNTFTDIDVLNNNALVDMKPFNTLEVFGESQRVDLRGDNNPYDDASSSGVPSEEYPYVKVQYGPLLDRAKGFEFSPNPIESDKVVIDAAEQQAKNELRKHLEETTEGSLQLRGEPHIAPHDYIVTLPVCEDTYRNVEAEPVEFEVNAVKHERTATEQYTTELGVSIQVVDSKINVVESEYRKVGGNGSE